MVDTAKRNAARLAPLLCSERISPLLCRCFFLLFKGAGRAARTSTSAFGLHLKRRSSNPFAGDRRAPLWLGSRCAPRTTSTHSLCYSMPPHTAPLERCVRGGHFTPPWSDAFEAVISHFTFEAKKVESGGEEGGRHRNHASGLDEA